MDVDIISMSLASYEEDKRVESAMKNADTGGRLLLCSAHDDGLNIGEAYPACMPEAITFAASDRVGQVTHNVEEKAYNFRIHATSVFAGVVPFMQFDENVSGSSVATAIGAGLSSLVIACHHLANNNRPKEDRWWKKRIVYDRLKAMESEQGSKYIKLEKFCDIDKKGKVLDIDGILEDYFTVNPKDLGSYIP